MASVTMDRRRLLQLAGASATTLWLPRGVRSQPRVASDPFALGVASGSPLHDSVVLWTRLVAPDLPPVPVTVRWEIAHDEAFARIVRQGQAIAQPQLAHSVHAEVQGLEPDRWYHYRFTYGEAVSQRGRTRTFPAPDAAATRLKLAYASCQRWDHGYYGAYRHMREEGLDLVLFLGDYIYEYPAGLRSVRVPPGGWAVSLADYRQRHALHKGEPELQAMHAACPWLVTWDDHEVQNDYGGAAEGSGGPAVADFAGRRLAAYQAFYEHMPLRTSAWANAGARVYSRHRFGRLADLLLLDTRQYRHPQACTRGGRSGAGYVDPADCGDWADPRRSLLGPGQERWLDGALAEGGSQWTVLGQQTLFGQRDARPGPGRRLWNDGWDGYPAARTRLTDALRRHAVSNPALFGGDLHENWVGHVKADYSNTRSDALGVEFCGTSITSRQGSRGEDPGLLHDNPHFIFADTRHRGYGVAEFTPARLVTTLRGVDDATKREPRIDTLAQFTVAAGQPRLERVA